MEALFRCIVCGANEFVELYPSTFEGTWREAVPYFLGNRIKAVYGTIVRCRQCRFTATSPQFSAHEYTRIYEQVPSIYNDDISRRGAALRDKKQKKLVTRYVKEGRFLDIGCADGSFVREMETFDGIGFEVRDIADPIHVQQNKIIAGDFLDYATKNEAAYESFDFVTSWNVFEHLPLLDDYMAGVARILKQNGHMFCTIPNIESLASRVSANKWNCMLLEHLWYFSPQTFQKYLATFGFEVLETSSFAYDTNLNSIAGRIAQTYGVTLPALPAFLGNLVISLPIGIMFVACRKTASGWALICGTDGYG